MSIPTPKRASLIQKEIISFSEKNPAKSLQIQIKALPLHRI